jgi:hypothetical protein
MLIVSALSFLALGTQAPNLPPYLALPKAAAVVSDTLVEETYGEADFQIAADALNIKRGRHFKGDIRLAGVPDNATHEQLWAPFRTALTAAGWTVARYSDVSPPKATLRYQRAGPTNLDVWLSLTMFGPDDIRMDLVEVRPLVSKLVLTPPAATPESLRDDGPFPYLAPNVGKLNGTEPEGGPLLLQLKGDK